MTTSEYNILYSPGRRRGALGRRVLFRARVRVTFLRLYRRFFDLSLIIHSFFAIAPRRPGVCVHGLRRGGEARARRRDNRTRECPRHAPPSNRRAPRFICRFVRREDVRSTNLLTSSRGIGKTTILRPTRPRVRHDIFIVLRRNACGPSRARRARSTST